MPSQGRRGRFLLALCLDTLLCRSGLLAALPCQKLAIGVLLMALAPLARPAPLVLLA